MDDVIVYTWGLCYLSACTVVDLEATTQHVNITHPTGIQSQWEKAENTHFRTGETNPCPCDKYEGRKHYLFAC